MIDLNSTYLHLQGAALEGIGRDGFWMVLIGLGVDFHFSCPSRALAGPYDIRNLERP